MKSVMIVDDEPAIRELMRRVIELRGAVVTEAATATEALALMAKDGSPAVALCDVRMPGHDGLWLAAQLRAHFPETAVVMTTAVNASDAVVTSLQTGVVDYVPKPFTRDRLHQALDRGFREHGSRRAAAALRREVEERRAFVAQELTRLAAEVAG